MKRLINILFFLLILSSCNQENRLDGLWYIAYSINDSNKIENLHETTLIEFESNRLYTIRIRDFSTGELDKVTIDTSTFEIHDSIIRFKGIRAKIKISADSIILNINKPKKVLVLRRLESNLKRVKLTDNCFKGSYLITGEKYMDSIDFINNSTLIHTGKYDMNFPAKKWEIIDYKGFKFFNVHNELFPVTIVKSCSGDKIELYYPFKENFTLTLTPTKSKISSKQLIGNWMELQNFNVKPPPPPDPNLNPEDAFFELKISQDSIQIKRFKRTKKLSWNLTSDGKRIYFKERILENDGSWKIIQLTDSTLTVRISRQSGFREEIIRLKKKKNGR